MGSSQSNVSQQAVLNDNRTESRAAFVGNAVREHGKSHFGNHYGDIHTSEIHYHSHAEGQDYVGNDNASSTRQVGIALAHFRTILGHVNEMIGARQVGIQLGVTIPRSLLVDHDILVNALETLLQDHLDFDMLSELLWDITGEWKWSKMEISDGLRYRLSNSYRLFLQTIERLVTDLEQLMVCLRNIQDAGEAALQGDPHDLSAQALKRVNKHVCCVRELAYGRRSRSAVDSRFLESQFSHIREDANSLFSLLQTAISQRCESQHQVCWFLRPCSGRCSMAEIDSQGSCAIKIIMHHGEPASHGLDPQTTRGVEPRSSNECSVRSDMIGLAEAVAIRSFSDETFSQYATEAESEGRTKSQCPARQHVNCTGRGVFWSDQHSTSLFSSTRVTLDQMLRKGQKARFPLAETRRIAHALAHGVLQLHQTPWLTGTWGKQDIVLFMDDSNRIQFRPSLSKYVAPQEAKRAEQYGPFVKNPVIFGLGVLLIELALKKPLESFRIEDDFAYGPLHEDLATAKRLVQEVEDEAGERYADIVSLCVECNFGERECSLENLKMQAQFYAKVVGGLEAELRHLRPNGQDESACCCYLQSDQ